MPIRPPQGEEEGDRAAVFLSYPSFSVHHAGMIRNVMMPIADCVRAKVLQKKLDNIKKKGAKVISKMGTLSLDERASSSGRRVCPSKT